MTASAGGFDRPGRARWGLPRRNELRELVELALPVVTVQVGAMMLGVVDSLMVGRISAVDLAAIALGNVYWFTCVIFGMGVLFALDPVIAQSVGAGDEEGVARGLQRGILVAVGLTVLTSVLLLPAGAVLTWARQPEEVVPVAAGYVLASIPGVLPFFLFLAFRQTLQSLGRMAPVVWTIVFGNVANVALNWVFIFGNLGVPRLGAVGSGWASTGARFLMAGFILAGAWPILRGYLIPYRPAALRRGPLLGFLRIGTPIGLQMTFEFGAFGAAGLAIGWLGTIAVAGHQIALNISALTFMVPAGVGQATAVLVGRAVGRGDPAGARRAGVGGLLLGVGFMCGTAMVFTAVPELLAGLYTPEVAVVALAASLLPIAGLFQVFDGIQVVAASILRGVGDTRVPMLMNLFGFLVIGLPVGLLLTFKGGLGARGIWWGLALGLALVSVLLLLRMRLRMGRELRRIVLDDEGPGSGPAVAREGKNLPSHPG